MSPVPGLPDPSDEERFDEEPGEHVPGSFLSALPQFFVFPLILVITVTAIYLLLRMLSGIEAQSATELVQAVRSAPGDQSRWQAAYNLSDSLRQGRVTLDDVDAASVHGLYDDLAPQSQDLKIFLLTVLAYKAGSESTDRILTALADDTAPEVREQALYALYALGDPTSVPSLLEVLDEGPWDEKWLAMGALGEIGSPEALSGLAARLDETESGLEYRNLVITLAAAGDARAAEWLAPMLTRADYEGDTSILGQDFGMLSEASREARQGNMIELFLVNACRAAESLGDASLIEPLQRLRQDDASTKVKSAAIHALDALGGSEKSQ